MNVVAGSAITWPILARAQQSISRKRIGVLLGLAEGDRDARLWIGAFKQRLEQLGWIEGDNIEIDYRWAGGNSDRVKVLATELVGLAPNVIFVGSQPAFDVMRQATRTIPIVFVQISDPVAQGVMSNLARPDQNYTGFANLDFSVHAKLIELLKQLVPSITRVDVLMEPSNGSNIGSLKAIQGSTSAMGMQVNAAGAHNADDIKHSFDTLGGGSGVGLVVLASPTINANRDLIIGLAFRHMLPAIYPYKYFVMDGGLLSYGFDLEDVFRGAASYVDRLLRGGKPADLPVQQPTKLEIVINLKTAKGLGLDVPATFLTRADEVIE
jgi:putative ABC transport system substrate-binding protein